MKNWLPVTASSSRHFFPFAFAPTKKKQDHSWSILLRSLLTEYARPQRPRSPFHKTLGLCSEGLALLQQEQLFLHFHDSPRSSVLSSSSAGAHLTSMFLLMTSSRQLNPFFLFSYQAPQNSSRLYPPPDSKAAPTYFSVCFNSTPLPSTKIWMVIPEEKIMNFTSALYLVF